MSGQAVYDTDTDWAKTWEPDHGLVPAVLAAGTRPIASVPARQDRCWLVAGLKVAGLTADDIADRLRCSLRLVRTLLAEDMTKVCLAYFAEADHFADELRLVRHELTVRTVQLDRERAEHGRVREQRDRLIDMAITGEPVRLCRHQHLLDKYNTYVHPRTGKVSCRTCRAEAVERYRSKLTSPGDDSSPATPGHGAPGGPAGVAAPVAAPHGPARGGLGPAAGTPPVAPGPVPDPTAR
ncbi:DNA binding protein [Mycobacterium phage Blocker23]|uniref:HNH endonuclease n=2 Tax=Rosebushvirus rosebush TaxID=2006145 RepID=A0A7G8LGV1_9CAUD|nr:DNA binding protein [Mycobacterium phage ItsyBitsy1]QNJ56473.1 HNH endonuclease [Mycobacterium phage MasterPo]UVK61473.1 DNA binding protein [Mycobacterium phage Blocker23]